MNPGYFRMWFPALLQGSRCNRIAGAGNNPAGQIQGISD